MIKAIFLDQDNTVFQTKDAARNVYELVFKQVSSKSGKEFNILLNNWKEIIEELKTSNDLKQRSFEYSLKLILDKENIFNEEDYKYFLDVYYKSIEENIQLLDGSQEFFNKVDKNIKLILFTEDSTKRSRFKTDKFNLTDRFDLILTSDDTGLMKPHIKYLQIGWEKFNLLPEECIYVGDNWDKDCALGQQNGGVGVVIGSDNRADYSIADLSELIEIVENFK